MGVPRTEETRDARRTATKDELQKNKSELGKARAGSKPQRTIYSRESKKQCEILKHWPGEEAESNGVARNRH